MAGASDVGAPAAAAGSATSGDESTASSPVRKTVPNDSTDTSAPRKDDDVVRINAGGTHFFTTAGTLRACGDGSVLHALADSPGATVPFLDRDASAFADLLRWARAARFGGSALPASADARAALVTEARALRLPALDQALREDALTRARVAVLVATLTTFLADGFVVDGYFVVAGIRSSSGWFGGFNAGTLDRTFTERVAAAVADHAKRTGLAPVASHTSTSITGTKDSRIMHILTITYSFGAPS